MSLDVVVANDVKCPATSKGWPSRRFAPCRPEGGVVMDFKVQTFGGWNKMTLTK